MTNDCNCNQVPAVLLLHNRHPLRYIGSDGPLALMTPFYHIISLSFVERLPRLIAEHARNQHTLVPNSAGTTGTVISIHKSGRN